MHEHSKNFAFKIAGLSFGSAVTVELVDINNYLQLALLVCSLALAIWGLREKYIERKTKKKK